VITDDDQPPAITDVAEHAAEEQQVAVESGLQDGG
jgi:hypothetical protein